ncbi:putative coil containing protein [Vibrio phage 466E53-1]|nr:putative coil containing protein [Vibrio phage 466E53-1]
MSEAKFTKGPWFYDNYMLVDGSVRVVHGNITITYHGAANDQDIANANLIAAAPEMYEMLTNLAEIMRNAKISYSTADEIDKLLAKARGEQND